MMASPKRSIRLSARHLLADGIVNCFASLTRSRRNRTASRLFFKHFSTGGTVSMTSSKHRLWWMGSLSSGRNPSSTIFQRGGDLFSLWLSINIFSGCLFSDWSRPRPASFSRTFVAFCSWFTFFTCVQWLCGGLLLITAARLIAD